jgi:DNA repair exonuclease SbcCD nuclease subunit
MKIQLASDLHLEFLQRAFPGERLIAPAHGVDVLVLAGDIANGVQAIDLFKDWPVPVLYVAGNHEFYAQSFEQLRIDLQRAAEGTSIRFLDYAAADFGGVRFLGATLWTDYCLIGPLMQPDMMKYAERRLNDHRLIRTQEGLFTAARALHEHTESRRWLVQELAKPYDGIIVVVTHHGQHLRSVHPRYANDPLSAAFACGGLDDLLVQADLWLHGHVHDNFDYRVHGCRVVANPRGYALNRHHTCKANEFRFENSAFQWACVIDVNSLSATGSDVAAAGKSAISGSERFEKEE